MDPIYDNDGYDRSVCSRPSTNRTVPKNQRRFHRAVVFCVGLMSVLLLGGLIGLGVHSADLSTIRANLTELLQNSDNKVFSLTEERDLLKANLTVMTEEQNRLRSLLIQNKTCPAGWTEFSCSCYFLSSESGSWTRGREDCRNRGADLVVIDSAKEQMFLSGFIKMGMWIGLNDTDEEGIWKWIDGTALALNNWGENQPDNGGKEGKIIGEEDCAHIKPDTKQWNDLPCETSLQWICEKII